MSLPTHRWVSRWPLAGHPHMWTHELSLVKTPPHQCWWGKTMNKSGHSLGDHHQSYKSKWDGYRNRSRGGVRDHHLHLHSGNPCLSVIHFIYHLRTTLVSVLSMHLWLMLFLSDILVNTCVHNKMVYGRDPVLRPLRASIWCRVRYHNMVASPGSIANAIAIAIESSPLRQI